ncbi:aminotransferase class I/II-fold pyridoxal phosphate-dependent enzyme [Echinicola jeungdonensis]|uniref:Aminotransferase n=1 Tax=Echinicola jeungdonensis TaxID=709343 RepID=A0ABV5J2B3_9BACT|nr:aminotransferase class I/II-fold pyridoxal phosphate-dependent enzyme [Echinicola jeungdonensis]MDN3670552.1 aminotransferase class I/II-fold pyridoxal phosphate-dependent enzyme [Echinicola jeungdonensis]
MDTSNLSKRGIDAASSPIRIDFEYYFDALKNRYHKKENPNGSFPMNVAENNLCWNLLKNKIASITQEKPIPEWVAGYGNPSGVSSFREAVAEFLSDFLIGCKVDKDRLAFSAGLTSVIEVTSFILGNPGDVVVFPAPSYPVYTKDIGIFSGLERFDLITHTELDELKNGMLVSSKTLDKTLKNLQDKGKKFKILVITNPDNPTGGIYSKAQLEEIADWCIENKIHLIVNEIYGLSIINTEHPDISMDYQKKIEFYSFGKIMDKRKNPYLHYWYSFSKDFGISGFRVGLVHSFNKAFLQAYKNVNFSHSISNYTQWIMESVLEDKNFIKNYIQINQERITESYAVAASTMKELKIPYCPARGSLFVWFDLSEFLEEDTDKSQQQLWIDLYQNTGMLITPAEGFGHKKRGQFRLVYSFISKEEIKAAMERFSLFIHDKRGEVKHYAM